MNIKCPICNDTNVVLIDKIRKGERNKWSLSIV